MLVVGFSNGIFDLFEVLLVDTPASHRCLHASHRYYLVSRTCRVIIRGRLLFPRETEQQPLCQCND